MMAAKQERTVLDAEIAFAAVQDHVDAFEGGLSDHPADRGGITNYGVSLTFLRNVAATPDGRSVLDRMGIILPVGRDTIRKLTRDQARAILRWKFWSTSRIHALPPLLAMAAYDFAVNSGAVRAVRYTQRILGVDDDGCIGKYTLAAALAVDPLRAALDLNRDRRNFLCAIVRADPAQAVFLRGWLRRVDALTQCIKTTAQQAEGDDHGNPA